MVSEFFVGSVRYQRLRSVLLTLLVGRQEEHPACKIERCGARVVICVERGANGLRIWSS